MMSIKETLNAQVLIIGAGPAGYSAAIYAARAGLSPVLVRGPEPGGQLMITTDVENYPGFRAPILGPQLMEDMAAQAQAMGTVFYEDIITDVAFQGQPLRCIGQGRIYEARAVILATGAAARWLGIDSETQFRGFGVSACATCDGFFFRGKRVAVVGGGNSAVEEALFLTHHASEVILIHRRDSLRAEHILQKRLMSHPKIRILWNRAVDEVLGKLSPHKSVTGLRLKDTQTGALETLEVDGVFVAIGHTPNTGFLKDALPCDADGYLRAATVESLLATATDIPGVFAAGDVRDKIYRQAVTAAGQGCMAALDVEKYLSALSS